MSKLLANQIANYNDNGPVEVKEGITVPSGKPFQIAGAAGNAGDYLKSTGSTIEWTTFPTIPSAQVNSDWNATSGVAQITNRPTLAAVATSGSYVDLSNKPTIPAAQVQTDWNQSNTNAVDYIQNKPSLFSGAYADLTGKPTIPSNLGDLANVSSNAPANNNVLKWNGSNWAPAVDATGSALSNIVDSAQGVNVTGKVATDDGIDIDTGGQITAAGCTLDFGSSTVSFSGATVSGLSRTMVNLANIVDSAQGVNVTGKVATTDGIDIDTGGNINAAGTSVDFQSATINFGGSTISGLSSKVNDWVDTHLNQSNPTSGHVLSWNGSDYAWVANSGGSGATVTTDDNAPSSPNDGDLWWKSNEGRLKVYYADGSSNQWVDAFPLQAAPTSINNTTTNGTNSINTTTSTGGSNANAIEIKTDNNTSSAVRWRFTPPGHLIPNVNAAYDIGNAEYKVRHLFLSDNTLYYEGSFLKVAQHDAGGSAGAASYLIPLAKLKDALNASGDYESFKQAILAITDA